MVKATGKRRITKLKQWAMDQRVRERKSDGVLQK
jgi:hypothetical protein